MSWIESHQSLSRHRKTLRAAELLKVDRHKMIGHLHELWWWGLDNADINGRLVGIGEKSITDAAGWPAKESAKFIAALQEAGFVEESGGQYTLHNWYDYAGKLNVRREKERQRAAERRAAEQNTADVLRTELQPPHDVAQPLVGTVPNRTVPNQDPSDLTRPTGKRTPKPKEPVPLTEEDTARLHEKHDKFAPAEVVQAVIDRAMEHEAALKYPKGCYRYVNDWLLGTDWTKYTRSNGRTAGVVAEQSHDSSKPGWVPANMRTFGEGA